MKSCLAVLDGGPGWVPYGGLVGRHRGLLSHGQVEDVVSQVLLLGTWPREDQPDRATCDDDASTLVSATDGSKRAFSTSPETSMARVVRPTPVDSREYPRIEKATWAVFRPGRGTSCSPTKP